MKMEISRREWLRRAALSSIAFGITTPFYLCRGRRGPNFIIIFTDDQGYCDAGCYGAKGFETPNLDRMASEGVRFTDFYVSEAVCSASRASLLTGCYAERVGIRGALTSWSMVGLNSNEETIAELLKRRGYKTAIFGKWHLGHHKKFLPLQHGFDEYFGLPYSNDMWPVDFDGTPLSSDNPGSRPWKLRYPPLPLIENNEKVGEIRTLEDQAKLTTLYTQKAIDFIEKNKERPFFLYLPHSMPHVPLGVSDRFKGKSRQGLYGDVIMEIDWSVEKILEALRKYGLEKNTLVIFTSDNGPWLNFGNHAGSALPLREGKGTMWEGGARVPCIMWWPSHIRAGSVCRKMAATIDILPTIVELAGAPRPAKKIDGVSIVSLLRGDRNANPRKYYYYYYGGQLRAVRQGRWKLVFPHKYRSYSGVEPGKNGYPGAYARGECGLELYDLKNDVGERRDVSAEHPDVVERLEKIAERAREDLGDTLTGRAGKNVREPGRVSKRSIGEKVHHLAVGKKIVLKNMYSPSYPGGGENGLINGLRGTKNFRDGLWQGFEGIDLEAVVDLGRVRKIRKISCGFLEDQISWIFFPRSVEIALSADGDSFRTVKKFRKEKGAGLNPYASIKEFTAEIGSYVKARYVKVIAENIGKCPDWHPGSGGKAWIFCDEIVVK